MTTKCNECGEELHCPACEIGSEDKDFAGISTGDLGNVVLRVPVEPEERHRIVIEQL